jgi:small subunit ribosomal protein S7
MESQIKAFNKWDMPQIFIEDEGIKSYITLDPRIVPKTGARYAGNRFHKSKVFIVERLINKIMIPGHKSKKHTKSSGHCTGKAIQAYDIVQKVFDIIEKKLQMNPIEVFVKAIEYASPREEVVSIEYGGARYPKAVEISPQRRIDLVLRYITQGAYQKSFNSKKKIEIALAEEIMYAYEGNQNSAAISKKNELERQADASR